MEKIEDNKFWRIGETTRSRKIIYRIPNFMASLEIDNIIKNNENKFSKSTIGVSSENNGHFCFDII